MFEIIKVYKQRFGEEALNSIIITDENAYIILGNEQIKISNISEEEKQAIIKTIKEW